MEEINSDPQGAEDSFVDILSRLEAETIATRQSAIDQAVDYMMEADLIDERRDVLSEARKLLVEENPRKLYIHFLKQAVRDLKTADTQQQYRIAQQINDVALAGLGIWQEDLKLSSVGKNQFRISGTPDWDRIEQHVNETVLGAYFLQNWTVPSDTEIWGTDFPLRLSACDASQHRLKLKVPTNKIWASPAIVNNAGGIIKEATQTKATWKNIAVPKGVREYEDWVILGPNDYATMDESDYEWSAKSAMDVGQFFVEETFVFRHGGTAHPPDVHFRDGRVFPQDKLMNCTLENRHGQLTREAIYRMVTTCRTARELGIMFCGVAKQVQLKVYSTLINWYISQIMGKSDWNPTQKAVNDTEMMRHLMPNPDFRADFNHVMLATPIVRKFETTSNLNRRTRRQVNNDLERLGQAYHNRNVTARDIADEALNLGVVMLFVGHARSNEQFLPRYEFVSHSQNSLETDIIRLLSGLRSATFDVDEDHLWGLDEPITTLIPTPVLVAHDISKKVGSELALDYKQRTLARFIERRSKPQE